MQADPHVEHPGEDGVTDREAPQHARINGVGVVVCQLADRAGCLDQRWLVVKVGQRHRRSAHQGAVSRGAASALMQRRRRRTGGLRRDAALCG
jgi:hypothetical protein